MTRYARAGILLILCMAWCGCSGEPEGMVRKKLEIILQDDLRFMKSEVPPQEVADSAHYVMMVFKHYPKDAKFSYNAVVEFYYFRNIQMKQVRKYRYEIFSKKWERYSKEFKNY